MLNRSKKNDVLSKFKKKGEWNLFVTDVTDTEAGEYKCKVSSKLDGKQKNTLNKESDKATLKTLRMFA